MTCSMNGPAALQEPSAPASWRIALPHTAAAVPVARALVRTALTELEHGADCDTAELLTAELVANAIEHAAGDGPIELWWSWSRPAARWRSTTPTRRPRAI